MNDVSHIVRKARALYVATRKSIFGHGIGPYRSSWSGAGFEFRQLRDYVPGDDIRYVDWKSSARANKLLIRDNYEEYNRTFIVILDCSASMRFTSTHDSKLSMASHIAMTLAYACHMHGDAIGYLSGANGRTSYVPPRNGSRHMMMVAQRMAQDIAHAGTDIYLGTLFDEVMRLHTSPVGIICISDFLHDAYEQCIRRASYRHEVIPVRVLDPQESYLYVPHETQLCDPETHARVTVTNAMQRMHNAWFKEYDTYFHHVMRRYGISPCTCYTSDDWFSRIRAHING